MQEMVETVHAVKCCAPIAYCCSSGVDAFMWEVGARAIMKVKCTDPGILPLSCIDVVVDVILLRPWAWVDETGALNYYFASHYRNCEAFMACAATASRRL